MPPRETGNIFRLHDWATKGENVAVIIAGLLSDSVITRHYTVVYVTWLHEDVYTYAHQRALSLAARDCVSRQGRWTDQVDKATEREGRRARLA